MTSAACTHTEGLFASACEAARKGRLYESSGKKAIVALEHLKKAISIFDGLVASERTQKRIHLLSTIEELKECSTRIASSSAYKLEMATKLHSDAKDMEDYFQSAPIIGQTKSLEFCLKLYSDAGDWYMEAYEALLHAEHTPRRYLQEKMQFLLDHVSELKSQCDERIKLAYEDHKTPTNETTCVPRMVDASESTEEEIRILERTSLINGKVFQPWKYAFHDQESLQDSSQLFTDPDGFLPLSSKQQVKFGCWKRPHEFTTLCGSHPVMIRSIDPLNVKQDIVTDCSFVASLCIAASYEKRFDKKLISNIILPVDRYTKLPIYNPKGKYIVKLWANGTLRRVVIDDYLPVSKKNPAQLLCSCTTEPNELWVSLLEKAYLKLNGGYDFPGGNSGVDLFALTGWIPEQVLIASLQNDRATEDRVWKQLEAAFHYGDCIITMTTEHLDKKVAKDIGLVPSHVYALLNVIEISQETGLLRLLQVKNPWRKRSWKGTNYSAKVLQVLHAQSNARSMQHLDKTQYSSSGEEEQSDDGIFWIDLESVKLYFNSFYMNWNPALFPHKHVRHAHWPCELGPRNDAVNLGFNPQYSISFDLLGARTAIHECRPGQPRIKDACIWVLLSRHVCQNSREHESGEHFITIHVYQPKEFGERVFYNENAVSRGTYTNNPHMLLTLEPGLAGNKFYTLVVSQYDKTAPLDYTLSIYSTAPIKFAPISPVKLSPGISLQINGRWRAETAGGRPLLGSFHRNPQYHVMFHRATIRLYFLLQTKEDCSELPVNLRIFLHQNSRVRSLENVMEIVSSGNYRSQFCYLVLEMVNMKDCILIPSTFEAGREGDFLMHITCEPSIPIDTVCSVTELAPYD